MLVADRDVEGRRRPVARRLAAWALASVLLAAASDCGSSSTSSFVDVTVEVDPGLDIDSVTMTASAPGKPNFVQTLTPASTIHTSFQPTGLVDGSPIRIEARGSKNLSSIVLARGDVTLRLGQHVTATLHLAVDCAGVVSCGESETCERGQCVPVHPPVGDGGMSDGPAGGNGGSAAVSGSGGAGVAGGGGNSGASGGVGAGTGGGAAGTGGGAAGRAGNGGTPGSGGTAGRAGSGGAAVGGAGGRTGSGGILGSGGIPGSGGVSGTGGVSGSGGSVGGMMGTAGRGTGGVSGTGGMPPPINVLVWNHAATFSHEPRIAAIPSFQAREATDGIKFDVRYAQTVLGAGGGPGNRSSDPSVFTDAGLNSYDVILFLDTSGPTLDADGQGTVHRQALIDFMKKGRGFVGIHSAADTYMGTTGTMAWPWYVDFVGANMADHSPAGTAGVAKDYGVRHSILAAANSPNPWNRMEEWLTFTRNVAALPGFVVLQTCTDTMLTAERPITWVHEMPIEAGVPKAGRMFYTGFGHLTSAFQEKAVMDLIIAGLKWTAYR